ncbi:MAG: hypothetical protein HRT71_07790 [Flavobacteriales bacterium]|nr:hypothetical protein [Flavobacteriales bacterium]
MKEVAKKSKTKSKKPVSAAKKKKPEVAIPLPLNFLMKEVEWLRTVINVRVAELIQGGKLTQDIYQIVTLPNPSKSNYAQLIKQYNLAISA